MLRLLIAINSLSKPTIPLISANPMMKILEVTGNQHYTFPMLTGVAPYDDLNVRKALKYGVNRQEMVDKVLLGHGAVANDHPIGPANQYFASDLPQIEYDASYSICGRSDAKYWLAGPIGWSFATAP